MTTYRLHIEDSLPSELAPCLGSTRLKPDTAYERIAVLLSGPGISTAAA